MKNNMPKRKVFNDAVDLLMADEPVVSGRGIQMIPIGKIKPFHNHPFHLYEGERLSDMVESIKEHGILSPAIVQKMADGYEMLAGHNRMNAAKIVGLKEIPAIVKEGLTEHEAYVYVIETNMLQRSFSELSISEKAAVLAERYDKVLYQRKRDEIITELQALESIEEKGGHGVHLSKHRDELGDEYGLSGRSVSRLLRVNQLIPEFRNKLDLGDMNLRTAVQLSYAPEDIQRAVLETGKPINEVMASRLREDGVKADMVKEIVCGSEKSKQKKTEKSVKLPVDVYERYLGKADAGMVVEIITNALKMYFETKGE